MPAAAEKSLQSCRSLCNPTDSSPPGSTVPGSLQAKTLEWVAISFSSAWKWKVKVKSLSHVQLIATPWTAAHQAPPSMGFSRQEYWSGVPLPSPSLCLDACFSSLEWRIFIRKKTVDFLKNSFLPTTHWTLQFVVSDLPSTRVNILLLLFFSPSAFCLILQFLLFTCWLSWICPPSLVSSPSWFFSPCIWYWFFSTSSTFPHRQLIQFIKAIICVSTDFYKFKFKEEILCCIQISLISVLLLNWGYYNKTPYK